ncbi:MAG: thioredoxin-disulfide reductase [Eubacterium sp.]|nr:thioredoxin-disulfide reductase [Eubacterium sp.]
MADVIIIGAGPAGLSAAIYVQRAGKTALVLEAFTYGGQIVNTPEVENYPGIAKISGFDFATALYEQATALGAEIVFDRAETLETDGEMKKVTTTGGVEYKARAVILATGAKNRHLGIGREEELTGRGVSYCATCDGAFFKGKPVAVNGGGNTALEDALFLSNYCSKVTIIHRREGFRGEPAILETLRNKENVEFVLNATVTALIGEPKLSAVEVTDKLSGEKKEIPVDGLFIAIGQEPDNRAFADLVELDGAGYIAAGEDCRTKTPGIFTAGDCRTKTVRQLTTAASDGAVAALAACQYLG